MKKFLASLAAFVAVVAIALTFAACSTGGTYRFEKATASVLGISTEYTAGQEMPGVGKLDTDSFTLELNNDGTCKIKVFGSATLQSGTWSEEDGTITFNISGITLGKATRDGDRITFTYGFSGLSLTVTLKK